jgi:hypothetical protein
MNTTLNNKPPITKSDKLRHFIKDVGLPLNKAPAALGLRPSEFMSWWIGEKPRLIKNNQVIQLGQYLHIDENDILSGTYDKTFVRSVLFSDVSFLPERYSQNQFSYLRSSAHIVKFLTMTRGQLFSDAVMRKMNISPLMYADMNNKISLNYFIDLLEILADSGLTQTELDKLSCVLFLTLGETPLGLKFKSAKNHQECYSVLSDNALLFDSNFQYQFKIDRKQAEITAFLPYENHSHMKCTEQKFARLLRYRQFLMGFFPYLSKLPAIIPHSFQTFHSEGLKTTYIIKFPESEPHRLYLVRNS